MRGLQDVRKTSRFPFSATALKIHVSPKTKEILDTFGTFELICRGEVILKVSSWYVVFFLNFAEIESRSCLPRLLSREFSCRFFLSPRTSERERTFASRIERDRQVISYVAEMVARRMIIARALVLATISSCRLRHITRIFLFPFVLQSFAS